MLERNSWRARGGVLLLLLLALLVYVQNAWLSDDAYITFRTIDNLAEGFGPRWNVAERVQSFTHPLWMILLAGLHMLTRELYVTTLVLSAVLLLAVLLLIASTSRPALGLLMAGALVASRAFIDFSSSGLENPLTHLLLGIFFLYATARDDERQDLMFLGLAAGLLILNRMDTVLLVAPVLAHAAWRTGWRRALPVMALALAPWWIWEVFAVIYYGFPFPNTAYAKLNTGLPWSELLQQGVHYYRYSFQHDPWAMIVIVAALAAAVMRRRPREVLAAAGIVTYGLYILRIGGDFMAARFFTAPLVVAVILLLRALESAKTQRLAAVATVVAAAALLLPSSPLRTGKHHYDDIPNPQLELGEGIADERGVYFRATNPLWASGVEGSMPNHPWAHRGRELRRQGTRGVGIGVGLGMRPYFAGPGMHFVSENALADPLLARLPLRSLRRWRIGHFRRDIPPGYLETLNTGTAALEDPGLSSYWQKLALITRGPVFDGQRLAAVVSMNLGRHDHLLDAEVERVRSANP